MSSTNRGTARQPNDAYVTPSWCTDLACYWLSRHITAPTVVLDPCAGSGAILDCVRDKWPQCKTIGLDIAPIRPGIEKCDALTVEWPEHDLIVMNPPYSKAEEFVVKALGYPGPVAALLRLSFLASRKRGAFWRMHPDCTVLVLAKRPSFVGGQTDSCDYAWFVWDRDFGRRWERL